MRSKNFIPVYQPYMTGNEKKYVNKCLDTNWISSRGLFIKEFEDSFANFIDCKFATSVSNGTVALHVALEAIGISPGDEVIVPSFTYVASVNTIIQIGATPVFVDCDENTLQIDPKAIEAKITDKTAAVMVVHIYGHPCDMEKITKICKSKNLLLIEDCAEAIGSKINGQNVGIFGDVATFSFFGNKTITTGEGGMVVSNRKDVIEIVNTLKNQAVSDDIEYWHTRLGYNYRMTNICAAIGLAQLENIDTILSLKRSIAMYYQTELVGLPLRHHRESDGTTHSFWMCSILTDNPNDRDHLRKCLKSQNIETRPFFFPANRFIHCQSSERFPISAHVSEKGLNLPSYPSLTEPELKKIVIAIKNFYS